MSQDPYKYFRVEAQELLEQMGKGALDLERSGAGSEMIPHLLRLAHTLKGAARVVRQREIADRAHAIEEALGPFRADAGGPVPRSTIDDVLGLVDGIAVGVRALTVPPSEPAAAGPTAHKGAVPRAPEEPQRTLRADVEEIDELLEGVTEAHGQLNTIRRSLESVERVRRLAESLTEQLGARKTALSPQKVTAMADDLRRLASASEISLASGVERVERELRQVRDAAERLRLLPARTLFNVLERAARDVAQSLGKRVLWEASGGDVRLDADVLGAVQPALVQVVRNAVAHGIEPEAARQAAGKSAAGRIDLYVERRGNHVTFRCRDDGRGVDLEGVRAAAAARGLAGRDTEQLPAADLLRLLLRGGISTSGTVTALSGRGIGLDIVREVASRLGGEVTVKTEAGVGTTLAIEVPVARAALQALVVEADDRPVAVPFEAVRRIVRLAPGEVSHGADGDSIVFEDRLIPFALLGRFLGSEPGRLDEARAWTAVVVESGGARAALGVSRLLGSETVVLRPLPDGAPATAVVAGASLDREGNPQLVLAPEVLVAEAARPWAPVPAVAKPRSPILVIDDSLTTRMLEQSILDLAGYDVDLAMSAEEGLEKARRRSYSLFLVDVEMPGMDGFSFVATTQADPALRQVPAILVTSRSAPEDRQRGAAVGAKAYIVKSEFDQTELLERIRTLVA